MDDFITMMFDTTPLTHAYRKMDRHVVKSSGLFLRFSLSVFLLTVAISRSTCFPNFTKCSSISPPLPSPTSFQSQYFFVCRHFLFPFSSVVPSPFSTYSSLGLSFSPLVWPPTISQPICLPVSYSLSLSLSHNSLSLLSPHYPTLIYTLVQYCSQSTFPPPYLPTPSYLSVTISFLFTDYPISTLILCPLLSLSLSCSISFSLHPTPTLFLSVYILAFCLSV